MHPLTSAPLRLCGIILLASSIATVASAQRAALVGVDANGVIIPSNGAASVSQLATAAGIALAQQEAADAAAEASAGMSNNLVRIEALISANQAHAILQGWVESFSSTVAPVTNCDVQIIGFARRAQGTNEVADIDTWFSAAPTNTPSVEWRSRLDTGEWGYLSQISNSWPNTVLVTWTNGVAQAYRSTVLIPVDQTSAFYRVNGAVYFTDGNSDVLHVSGGLAVNNLVGITTNRVWGSVTNHFVGGILVP